MNVLSLFDGISCGQVALERAGIKVDTYYASEIDEYAIQVAQKNYPNTVQLGNVEEIDFAQFIGRIDLLIGGSPCQGFSRAGEGLNFDDPRSKLFFKFVEAVRIIKPKYFLLENVKMKQEWKDIITEYMGIEPIMINSSLVSAQNRERLYWTNIPNIKKPEDSGLMLEDVILDDVYPVILHNLYGGFKEKTVRVLLEKSPTIRTSAGGGHIPSIVKNDLFIPYNKLNTPQFKKNYVQWDTRSKGHNSQDQRAFYLHKKHGTLPSMGASSKVKVVLLPEETIRFLQGESSEVVAEFFRLLSYQDFKGWKCIRKLHPIECERLQTLPDNYTEGVSNTQRYKMIGNGWTVDVIAHIFKYIR